MPVNNDLRLFIFLLRSISYMISSMSADPGIDISERHAMIDIVSNRCC